MMGTHRGYGVAFAITVLLLCYSSKLVLGANSGREFEGLIDCVGVWNNCTSFINNGDWKCQVKLARNPFQSTTCHLQNVCALGNVLEIYSDNPLVKAFDGMEVPTSPFTVYVEQGDATNVHISVRPLNQLLDDKVMVVNSSFSAVLLNPVQNKNVGHIYGDEIWPAFQMLSRYNYDFDHRPLQIVLMDYLRPPIEKKKEEIHSVFSDLATFHLRKDGKESARRCFSSLYVGSNAMSYSESSPDAATLDAYRHFLLKRSFKLWNSQTSKDLIEHHGFRPTADRVEPNILVLEKDSVHAQHPTLVLNYDELTSALRSKFPVHNITRVVWHGKTQREQIRIAQESDIFFSFPGSDVMNALFLPAGSTLLTPCRAQDAKWKFGRDNQGRAPNKLLVEYGNEVRIWFNAMPHLRSVQMCGDNVVTFDKSKYMTPASFHVDNILNVVDEAIKEWKLRRALRERV